MPQLDVGVGIIVFRDGLWEVEIAGREISTRSYTKRTLGKTKESDEWDMSNSDVRKENVDVKVGD